MGEKKSLFRGMEGHGTIMRKHHILTAVVAAAVFSLGASTLALAGEESTSGGTFTYARSDSTTSFDLHQEITENNAFAITMEILLTGWQKIIRSVMMVLYIPLRFVMV